MENTESAAVETVTVEPVPVPEAPVPVVKRSRGRPRKFDVVQEAVIRQKHTEGATLQELATANGCSIATVAKICKR